MPPSVVLFKKNIYIFCDTNGVKRTKLAHNERNVFPHSKLATLHVILILGTVVQNNNISELIFIFRKVLINWATNE